MIQNTQKAKNIGRFKRNTKNSNILLQKQRCIYLFYRLTKEKKVEVLAIGLRESWHTWLHQQTQIEQKETSRKAWLAQEALSDHDFWPHWFFSGCWDDSVVFSNRMIKVLTISETIS